MDQNQEHVIKLLKSEGGSKGLYGNPEEKDMVEISRPIILEALNYFENREILGKITKKCFPHPESSVSEQAKFIKDLDFSQIGLW